MKLERVGHLLLLIVVSGFALSLFLVPVANFISGPPAISALTETAGTVEQADAYCRPKGAYASISVRTSSGLTHLVVGCADAWSGMLSELAGKSIKIGTRRPLTSLVATTPLEVWYFQIDGRDFIRYADEVERSKKRLPYLALLALLACVAIVHMAIHHVRQMFAKRRGDAGR